MPRTPNRIAASASPSQVAVFRLQRHHLRDARPRDAVTICGDVCGVQAQVMSAAYLQFRTRNQTFTRAQIEEGLWKSRTLVKTTAMRQTLHIVPASEFPLYVSAVRSALLAAANRISSKFGVGAEESDAVAREILDALSSGPLVRPAITAAIRPRVSKRVHAWMDRVWSILRVPVAEGQICYGPGEGNQVKFIRVDQWLPKMKTIPEAHAQRELLRKYLRAYGPATVHDFAHWSGIAMGDSRRIHADLKDELVEVMVNGETCVILREDLAALKRPARPRGEVRLLPLFDPYLLAHAEKDHLLEALHYKRVYRNQGWISSVVLLDGKIVATWSYRLERSKIILEIQPFQKLSKPVRSEVEQQAENLAAFFGKEAEITFAA